MLDIKYILNNFEIKATAELPISAKETEKILAQFKGDWTEALTVLWISLGAVITDKVVSDATFANTIAINTTEKINTIYTNWREDILKPLYGQTIFSVGNQTSKIISNAIGSIMRFDIANAEIVNYINTETLSLAVDLKQDTFINLHQTLRDSFQNDWNKVTTKRFLKQNMTLTNKEMVFVKKRYLQMIESETLRGIEELGLSPFQSRQRAVRFAVKESNILFRKAQNARITRIHRTETVRMKGFSDIEALNQAEATGKIDNAFKTWVKTNSTDNWNSTTINNGRTIPYKNDWLPGSPTTASSLKYPSEISEHCYQKYKIKFKKVA